MLRNQFLVTFHVSAIALNTCVRSLLHGCHSSSNHARILLQSIKSLEFLHRTVVPRLFRCQWTLPKQRFYLNNTFLKNTSIWRMSGPVSCVLGVHTSIHAEDSLVSHNDRVNEARTMVYQPIAECHPPYEIWFMQRYLILIL